METAERSIRRRSATRHEGEARRRVATTETVAAATVTEHEVMLASPCATVPAMLARELPETARQSVEASYSVMETVRKAKAR